MPIPSISTLTTSPGRNQRGGVAAIPTPSGVPVKITVTGSRVVLPLKNAINVGTSKIMSLVLPSCTTSPFKLVPDQQ